MSSKIKYLLFDAANTLIHKPQLWVKMESVLTHFGYKVDTKKLLYNHKLLSESVSFPDRTNKDFYWHFNTELLYSLGIVPNEAILEVLFSSCYNLPWESFDDCTQLENFSQPRSILSNFNSSLVNLIAEKVSVKFNHIITSEMEQIHKPSVEFYRLAMKRLGVNAHEILYIGDSIRLDYEPATKVGMKSVVIDRINFYPPHDFIIRSFSEISNYI